MNEIKISVAIDFSPDVKNFLTALLGGAGQAPRPAKKEQAKPVEEKANGTTVSMEQIRELAKEKVKKNRDGLKQLLSDKGLKKVTDAKPEQYEDIYNALKEIA